MDPKNSKVIFLLSFIILFIGGFNSIIGVSIDDFYSRETLNWQVQSITQDYCNIIILVFLVLSGWFIYKKKEYGYFLWMGTILYFIYIYLIYCFDVHFNELFSFYCIVLSLCLYSLLYFIYSQMSRLSLLFPNNRSNRITGWYFFVLSILFYALWLLDVIPAIINHHVPYSLTEVNLPTNPVHVIDLSIFLPGLFISGILILKQKPLGYWLAPVILTFLILMDITICFINLVMVKNEITNDKTITIIMIALGFATLALLISNLKHKKIVS